MMFLLSQLEIPMTLQDPSGVFVDFLKGNFGEKVVLLIDFSVR